MVVSIEGKEEESKKEADKYIRYEGKTNDFENPLYDAEYKASLEDIPGFWKKQAEELHWFKKSEKLLDTSDQYLHRWFPDGETNICYNAVDRHVEAGRGDVPALVAMSVYTETTETYTYRQL